MRERYRRGGRRDHEGSRGPSDERVRYDAVNRGDYRGDFGREGDARFDNPVREPREHDRRRQPEPMRHSGDRDRDRGIGGWDRQGREGWERGRMGGGGFGSEYGAWRAGVGSPRAGFGFGREEDPGRGPDMYGDAGSYGHGDMNTDQPGRGFDDSDWVPNRPARGRGVWAGDWADESGGLIGGGRAPMREDYSGRGPRDYRRSDDRIREEVCDRLTDDRAVDATEVSVRVESGEVTLTGTVPGRDQKRRAEESAERISGVRDVINQLRVARADTIAPPQTSAPASGRAQRTSSSPQQPGVAADRSGER